MKLPFYLSAILLAAGCAQPTKSPEPLLRASGKPVVMEESPSDETIGLNVRRRLDLIGPAETLAIVVEVVDGVVTLRGSAPNQNAAWKAAAAARSVKGVKNVVSNMVFQPTAR